MGPVLRFMVLCIAICGTTAEQVFHVVAPNTFRLNADETIAVSVDGNEGSEVNVFIQDYPGRIKNLEHKILNVIPGQPEIFTIRLTPEDFPDGALSTNGETLVTLNVQAQNFHKEIQIPVNNHAGYVFIQTDKPIYTPKQKVQIRVIALNEEAIPSDKEFKLQIKNPQDVVVIEKTYERKNQFQRAFITDIYDFPPQPVIGEWSVVVNYGYKLEQKAVSKFILDEYVLPTFTVKLTTPDVILETDEEVPILVEAEYVYGKKVKGMVTFEFGVKGPDSPKGINFAVVGPVNMNNGAYQYFLKTNEMKQHKNIGWFPGIEGSYLTVEATVMDDASGNRESAKDAKPRFSKTPLQISFSRCLKDFRPGLISVFEADVNYFGGKPASGIRTRITATTNRGPLNIENPISVSDDEGKVAFRLHPEMEHDVISITLETNDDRFRGKQAKGHFEQRKFQSKDFIAIERSSTQMAKVGEMFVKIVHLEPPKMTDIYYAVISKGKIVHLKKFPEGERKVQKLDFLITHKMVPNFRLVVWTHYQSKLLADSLNIDVENSCHPDSKVAITPEFPVAEPGAPGKIIINGVKNTLVGILGVDEAVYALSKKDLLTKSKMFKAMAEHDLGCGPGGGLNTDEVLSKAGLVILTNAYSPSKSESSCVEVKRRKRSVASNKMSSYSGVEKTCCALGMSHDNYGRTCEERTNVVVRYLQGQHLNCSKAFLECCVYAKENGFSEMKLSRTGLILARMGGNDFEPEFVPIEEEAFFEKGATVRSDFRETWIFQDKTIGPDKREEIALSLPHSITTWVIQAIAVSHTSGMCIMDPQKVVSFKKIFIQLNLPYSVVRNEQVEIQAVIFNYGPTKIGVVVYMYGQKDLCTGANENEKSERKRITIEKNSAQSVSFPVIPLKEGTYDIKVVALSPDGSDIIERKLNVVPEGEPKELNIGIVLDPSNQQKRRQRHISNGSFSDSIDPNLKIQTTAIKLHVPQNFVPGTESCTIAALGDRYGPVIETALTNPDKLLLKPRGCGEQNMVYFAPTLYTIRYLKTKGKISPEIEEKGYKFIREGYGNQLAFRKEDGSYSAYQSKPTSVWLTAFVVKVFCQANNIVHIDENVMCSGVRWLLNHQQEDGSFIEFSPVYHIDMMGGVQGKTPLTAFTLVSLEECKCDAENLNIAKKRAQAYLEEHLGDVQEPLPVAITAYALSLSDSNLKKAANDKLMSIAHHDEDSNRIYWGSGNSAQDIEATSYALLNQLLHNDMIRSNSIVNWLNSQQLQSGSFKSTQDTVIGLQALSEYAIRAQMPHMNLVANITSSNDRLFNKVVSFDEANSHVLQHIKVDKVGGMLFVHTMGQGVGLLSVKLRYNLVDEVENVCKFSLTVNATEAKINRNPLEAAFKRRVILNNPNLLPDDLIRGLPDILKQAPDVGFVIDPRNRNPAPLIAPVPIKLSRSRARRHNADNSKLRLKISVCTRYLGDKPAEMSIVDVGIFSGFVPVEDDLHNLVDENLYIERFEKSSRGVVFYLKSVPNDENYCFNFHVTREYIVGNTQTSIVKVYAYYNPDATCSAFYRPDNNSPLLRTLCEGGVCQCAEGGCPPKNPFEKFRDLPLREKVEELLKYACDFRYCDFVWKGKLQGDIKKENGFYNITFEISSVVKEGIEKKLDVEGETRNFLARDNCESAKLLPGRTFLIMGKDGQKYKNENDVIWYRYLLDKKAAIHLWTNIKQAIDKDLQRALIQVEKKLKSGGCNS